MTTNLISVKTSELTGAALDWAVAKCEGRSPGVLNGCVYVDGSYHDDSYSPHTTWAQGGPIIERERIALTPQSGRHSEGKWFASHPSLLGNYQAAPEGPIPLVAAMRCFIASRLGDKVEIPEELLAWLADGAKGSDHG